MDLKFSTALESFVPEVQPSKKWKEKNVAKEKKIIQVNVEDTLNFENRLEIMC